jgi:hypothetical protein
MPKNCFLDSLLAAAIGKYNDTSEHRAHSHLPNDSQNRWFPQRVLKLGLGDPLKDLYQDMGKSSSLVVKTFSNKLYS